MEVGLLQSRIEEAELKISYLPPGDGLCFCSAAGFQLGLSCAEYSVWVLACMESNRYDVSIEIFFDPKIKFDDVIKMWL
jgi:hypothetical protein